MFSKNEKNKGLNFVSTTLQKMEEERQSYQGVERALFNLEAAGLLVGPEGEADRKAILDEPAISGVINRMSTNGLLNGANGVANFNGIKEVNYVPAYAIGLELLASKGLLDGEEGQANRNVLKHIPHAACYFARMLCALHDAGLLIGLKGQHRRDQLAECTNMEFTDVALSALNKSGLLKGVAGPANFEAIMRYQKGEAKSLIGDLNDAGLLSGPAGQANFNAVLKHQNLRAVNLELIYDSPGLLTGPNAQTNFNDLMARHAPPKRIGSQNRIDYKGVNISKASNDLLERHSSSMSNINMMVLGGFIAVAGIATVAIAFTLLNTATIGIAGFGAVVVLSGIGLFATGSYQNRKTTSETSLELSGNLMYQ